MGVCGCYQPRPGGCPACNPSFAEQIPAPQLPPSPMWFFPPKGCVCPAGAEKTCERSDCGRRDPVFTVK